MNIKLRLKPQIELKKINVNEFQLSIGKFSFFIKIKICSIADAFFLLKDGLDKEKLVALAENSELKNLIAEMHKYCCFEYYFFSSVKKESPSYIISPKTPSSYDFLEKIKSKSVDNYSLYKFSKFTYFNWENSGLVIKNPISNVDIFINDSDLIIFLVKNRKFSKIKNTYFFDSFFYFLEKENFIYNSTIEENSLFKMWNFQDLLFHKSSRMQEAPYPQDFGACKQVNLFHEDFFSKPLYEHEIILEKPDLNLLFVNDHSLSYILEKRQTRRKHNEIAISKKQLGELLYRVFHLKENDQNGKRKHHVFPNAGNLKEFEIYILINKCIDLDFGIYHYSYKRNSISKIDSQHKDLEELLKLASCAWSNPGYYPQILINLSCNFSQVFSNYKGIGYRNSLVNAGSIVQTIYLIAESMNLAACCLGYGCSDLFAKIINHSSLQQTSILEIAIGTRVD